MYVSGFMLSSSVSSLVAAGHVPPKIWEVFQLNNMGAVAVKENMVMTNILCQGWRGVCHLDQLVVILNVNKPEQIVPPIGCRYQVVVDRMLCRNIFPSGNFSLLSIAEEVDHETLRQSLYANEGGRFSNSVKLNRFK